jgi:hypothetical protein
VTETTARIRDIGAVPVIVPDDPGLARPLGRALADGGLPCAEATFRTRRGRRAEADGEGGVFTERGWGIRGAKGVPGPRGRTAASRLQPGDIDGAASLAGGAGARVQRLSRNGASP